MTKAELIQYIREHDSFYKTIDLESRSMEELMRLKELIETITKNDETQNKKRKDK
jgi:hypothetical protein